ncbi:MAG: hypothetical protein IPP87_03180 [Ideonella sp.]|nr:hypothetical protein [Ideonella sp.]
MNTTLQEVALLAPSLGPDWKPFADRLAAALAKLSEDQNLILSVENRQRFVQFAGSGASGLRAEAVSNAYLAEADQLTVDQVAALIAAGWRSPTHAPDASMAEKDPAGSPNFFADFDAPVPFDEVADLAVRTLAQVFEVSHPDQLEYDAFDTEGNQISFPGLCRRRAQRPGSAAESDSSFAQELLAAIREVTGFGDLEFDNDGDICLPQGSQVVFVRRLGATPFMRIWSPLVRGVRETPELLGQLNSLNASAGLVRFSAYDGVVFAEADVAAEPIVAKHVDIALRRFCAATDGVDAMLQREFGGGTAFEESLPSTLLH